MSEREWHGDELLADVKLVSPLQIPVQPNQKVILKNQHKIIPLAYNEQNVQLQQQS